MLPHRAEVPTGIDDLRLAAKEVGCGMRLLRLGSRQLLCQANELGAHVVLLRAQSADPVLQARECDLGQLPGSKLGAGLVDPGLPLLDREPARDACGVLKLDLGANQGDLSLVEDHAGLVAMGGGLAHLLPGHPGRHRASRRRVLRRPTHKARVTRDEAGGELSPHVGKTLVDQEHVVVVGLLVRATCGPSGGSPLVHDGAEDRHGRGRLRMSGDRLEHRPRGCHARGCLLSSREVSTSTRELRRDGCTAHLGVR